MEDRHSRVVVRGASIGRMTPQLHITQDAEADDLLSTDPLALLIGMLLDQQVR